VARLSAVVFAAVPCCLRIVSPKIQLLVFGNRSLFDIRGSIAAIVVCNRAVSPRHVIKIMP
jgi:hypothetical protein